MDVLGTKLAVICEWMILVSSRELQNVRIFDSQKVMALLKALIVV